MLVQLLEKFNTEQFDLMAIDLQRILHSHYRRIGQFHKALITRSLLEDYDYEKDNVHRTCMFGQWYYSQTAPEIKQNEEFVELGRVHEAFHAGMRTLLRKTRTDGLISTDEYDLFLAAYNLFTDKLADLINERNFAQYQFDPLTKLLNRRAFNKILEYEFNLLQRNKRPCTIAMTDIDHFKNINDTYGHSSGDIVLKSIAGLFLKQLRGYDTVGRFGGEEFIFCLPNTSLVSAKKIMERLRKKVEHMEMPLTNGIVVRVTISIGIAEFKTSGAIDEALHYVDKALYKAKESGRNRVEVAALP
jgi:diguanylate cyclase